MVHLRRLSYITILSRFRDFFKRKNDLLHDSGDSVIQNMPERHHRDAKLWHIFGVISPTYLSLKLLVAICLGYHSKPVWHRPADRCRSASPAPTADTYCLPPHFPQRHKIRFVNFRIWQAMRVAIHTQIRQAMRVLIHTHISCRLLVEGNAPKPL